MSETGQHGTASCPGYLDEHGQWNNGFSCLKWSSKPNQQYCCGSQYKRYCCPPGEKPFKVTNPPYLTLLPSTVKSTQPPLSTITTTSLATTERTTDAATTVPFTSTLLQNIPLIIGVSAGSLVFLVILILVCCCVCPCCPMRKKGRNKNLPPDDDKTEEEVRSERRISDFSDSTLQRPLTPSYRSESPPVPEMTVIPMCYTDTDTLNSNKALPLSRTKHSPYKGVVVGTVPPFVREDPPPYPEEVLESMKPLMYSQLCCNERNCPKCQNLRMQELCQLEVAVNPHQHCIQGPLSASVSSLHSQSYSPFKSSRYGRPMTPVLNPQSYRHYQVQNRGYIM